MDNFAEQLVKKELSGSDRVKKGLILAGGIFMVLVLTVSSLLMLGHSLISFVGLILAAGAGYGTFFLLQSMNVEYEYTFTNGTLDVAKIIAKKRRKEILSVDGRREADLIYGYIHPCCAFPVTDVTIDVPPMPGI